MSAVALDVDIRLGERDIAVWQGNHSGVEVMRRLALEDGAVRTGIVHRDTAAEVERLLGAPASL